MIRYPYLSSMWIKQREVAANVLCKFRWDGEDLCEKHRKPVTSGTFHCAGGWKDANELLITVEDLDRNVADTVPCDEEVKAAIDRVTTASDARVFNEQEYFALQIQLANAQEMLDSTSKALGDNKRSRYLLGEEFMRAIEALNVVRDRKGI